MSPPLFLFNPSLCGCVFNGFSFFSLTRLGNICNPRVIPDFPPFFPDFYIGTKMTLYSFTRKFWHLQIYKKTSPECKWRYRFYRIYKKIIIRKIFGKNILNNPYIYCEQKFVNVSTSFKPDPDPIPRRPDPDLSFLSQLKFLENSMGTYTRW